MVRPGRHVVLLQLHVRRACGPRRAARSYPALLPHPRVVVCLHIGDALGAGHLHRVVEGCAPVGDERERIRSGARHVSVSDPPIGRSRNVAITQRCGLRGSDRQRRVVLPGGRPVALKPQIFQWWGQ